MTNNAGGQITNDGTVSGTLTNSGTITNQTNGTISGDVTNNGTIVTYGEISGGLTNNGTIMVGSGGSIPSGIGGSIINLSNETYLDESGTQQSIPDNTKVLLPELTTLSGWYAVCNKVTLTERLTVTGEVHLILMDSCKLDTQAGITVKDDNSLTIYAQSNGRNMGELTAKGGNGQSGIGNGSNGDNGGNITINGGNVTATGGGYEGAGIGGWGFGAGGKITINGGTVTATSGNSGGAGIGGRRNGAGGTIIITGGTVTATGGNDGGAGIGGGYTGTGDTTIIISGGTVTATGGNSGGAGIGDGGNSAGGTFSTMQNGNAFIIASSISDNGNTTGWSGMIFQGDKGQVYGAPTFETDMTVPGGKTLEIPEGTTLTIDNGVTLTNEGKITNNGTIQIDASGCLKNNGTIACAGTINGSLSGSKAIPTIPDTLPSLTAVYGQTLNDVSLPDGWRWENASTSVGNAGTNHFPAIYFKDKSGNYSEVTKNLPVTVSAASRTITVTGQADSPTQVTLNDAVIDPSGTGGNVSYGRNTSNVAPSDWQREKIFSGLNADTTYYFFAKVGADGNYAEAVSAGVQIATPAKGVSRIEIVNQPAALSYTSGQTLDLSGLTVTVSYDDGTTGTIAWEDGQLTADPAAGTVLTVTGHNGKTVAISYGGQTAETNALTVTQGTQTALSITGVGDKTYGDPAFTLSTTGGSGTGAVTFTSSDPSIISISGITATIYKAGGPVTITATKAEDGNYNAATATLTVTVGKKAVVFKANNKTVQQGGTMPTFDYAPVTLAQGDSITTEPTAACTATDTNTTGTFLITLSGAVLSNGDSYDISYQPGTLTVTAKPSTGGGGGGYTPPSTPTYPPTVEKPSEGGSTPSTSPSNPKPGDTVTVRPRPDDGYEVDTITVTDKNGKPVEVTVKPDGTYTFKQPSGKVTIEVSYKPIETPWNNPFADVSENDWYYEAVRFVQERGLMNGIGNGNFAPNAQLSRAQLAQILFNKEGRPGVNYLLDFSDVAGEAWYTEAVRWATSQGIVGGYGNGTFGPNDPITREQLAVMLWRYSGSPAATGKELHFNDTDEISGFALEALRWAVENGILNGYGDGRLGPQGQATRAQVAQMLKNFIENQEETT